MSDLDLCKRDGIQHRVTGNNRIQYSRFHPIKFAQYCWCRKCKRIVNKVTTLHGTYGAEYGPWDITVECHGESWSTSMTQEMVNEYINGFIEPVMTEFFGSIEPALMTNTEVLRLVNQGKLSRDF